MNNFQLYNGDCLEVMKNIPDNSIDMILCDLPYGTTQNKWDSVIPFEPLWEQYNRVAKKSAAIVLFSQGQFYVDLVNSNKDNFRYDIVWDKMQKTGFLNANRMPMREHEQIAVFYRSKPVYNPQKTKGKPNHSRGTAIFTKGGTNNNYGKFKPIDIDPDDDMKYPGSILSFQKLHPSVTVHPTQKPIELLEYLIRTYTNEGDTVLDNTMGSGSTGVACVNTNRNFIGIELDKNYFNIAKQRIEEAKNKLFQLNHKTKRENTVKSQDMEQNSMENIDWSGTWVKRPFSHPERTIRIATSCSGIGAPEEALKQLGLNYEIVFAGDIDKYAKQSYFANHSITEDRWHNDIRTVDATAYKGNVDLFVSGICCQSFSRSNSTKRMGVDDPLRGDLYKSFIRIVNECKPKVFVFENVDDILRFPVKGEGITCWEKIRISLEKETGYDLHWQVMNARHYGVPQNRPRLFCVGFKEKTDFLFPAPIELKSCLGDYLEKGARHKNYLRYLTPDESVKLMGFRDFKKVVPDSQVIKQSGNSIVVDVLKALYLQLDISKYGV